MTNKISTYIEKRREMFEEKFQEINVDYYDRVLYTTKDEVIAFHQETIEGVLEMVREVVENARFDITPIEESIEAGMTISEAHNVHSNAYGYNNALDDILNELPVKVK